MTDESGISPLRVWAPHAGTVELWTRTAATESRTPMTAEPDGWWEFTGPLADGLDYGFVLDGGPVRPDPRSRRQPEGVHGPSRVHRDTFSWNDGSWAGRGLSGAVLYELHIGTFTAEGTFDAAIERLDYLADLGVTHLELLPVNSVNGVWNWGYDGVLWYAVHEPYGGPDGLKRFVDACHTRGLAVTLDVVYNHLGPSGNYLPDFGPYLKTGRNTWGDLVNLDGEGSRAVRDYILDNALMWLSEFHIDSLRLDAVHALQDTSSEHLLAELSRRVAALSSQVGRPLPLIAESDLNDPIMFTPREDGGYGLDAQWDDDVHHSLHALLSGERQGYYDDFGTLSGLAKVLTHGFFHDGTYSTFRKRDHGKPVPPETPGRRFVVCLQNHDQIGNRAAGDRLPEITSPGLLQVGAVLLLSSPFVPMLFMGEEWAASTRWPFFTSHPEPELAEATGKGRVEEFAEHGWDVSEMIDPQDEAAFTSAKLNWPERLQGEHAEMLSLYRHLIRLRSTLPSLSDAALQDVRVEFDENDRWIAIHRRDLTVVANVGSQARTVSGGGAELLLATSEDVRLSADQVVLPAESAAIIRR